MPRPVPRFGMVARLMRTPRTFIPLLTVLALLVGACGGGDSRQEIVVGGEAASDPDVILADGERIMREEATTGNANLASDAKCFFSYANDNAEEANSFLRCGPVLFMDSEADSPWMQMSLTRMDDWDDEEGVPFSVSLSSRSSKLSGSEVLRRPDGAKAPDEIDLELPAPPPVDRDFVEQSLSEDVLTELPRYDGDKIRLPGTDIVVQRYGRANEIGTGANRLIAPDGHEIVTVAWTIEDGYLGYDPSNDIAQMLRDGRTLVLLVDGKRIPVDERGDRSSTRLVVPEDADVALEAEWKTYKVTLDLDEGSQDGGHPLLYDEDRDLRVSVNKGYSSAAEWTVPDSRSGQTRTAQVSFKITDVSLFPWSSRNGPADEGKAWMFIDYADWSADDGTVNYKETFPFEGFATIVVGDETFETMDLIQVPIDATSMTATVHPKMDLQSNFGPETTSVQFPDRLEFTVDFSTGRVN